MATICCGATEWTANRSRTLSKSPSARSRALHNAPALQSPAFLEVDEPGGGGDKIRAGLKRRSVADLWLGRRNEGRTSSGGRHPVRLGWAWSPSRMARYVTKTRMAKARSCTAPTDPRCDVWEHSSTSITAPGRSRLSRRFSITWSMGNTWLKWLSYDNRSATLTRSCFE